MRAFVLCWLLCGCATPPVAELPEAPATDSIFLVSQGWHTGIAVRRADIPDPLLPEKRDLQERILGRLATDDALEPTSEPKSEAGER